MKFRRIIEIDPRELAEDVHEMNSVDEIVSFITDCIPDDEVAEAVVEKLKRMYPTLKGLS